jgi:hypothetical protein
VESLPGELVITIEHNFVRLNFFNRENAQARIGFSVKAHADLYCVSAHAFCGNIHDEAFVKLAVAFGRWHSYFLFVAGCQALESFLETWNDITSAV